MDRQLLDQIESVLRLMQGLLYMASCSVNDALYVAYTDLEHWWVSRTTYLEGWLLLQQALAEIDVEHLLYDDAGDVWSKKVA